MADSADRSERARRAGRGLVAIAGVKAFHIVTGYAIAVLLPWILGSPAVFGLYSKVTAAVAILDNVILISAMQSVSKFVSEDAAKGPRVFRGLAALQVGLGGLTAGALFVCAPLIAAVHRDPALTPLLRVMALVPLSYALYAAMTGFLNGQHRFAAQSKLDAMFYAVRALGILGAAALIGGGALAPIGGYAAASVIIAAVALFVVGIGAGGGEREYGRWMAFIAPLWLYHLVLNGILELDVQVLARAVSELAAASGEPERVATEIANVHVGFYHAAQTFAFVPYQLMLAMTFVVFPMVSRATSSGDEEEARATIRGALRFSLLALLSVAAPIAGAAGGVMRLAYPDEYLAGAPALGILAFGIVAFALFVVAGTILTSAARPLPTALIAIVGLAVTVACNYLFVKRVGIGEDTLAAAALGTSAGMGVAFLLAAAAVYRRFRTLFPPLSLLRGGVAAAAAFTVSSAVPHGDRLLAVAALAAGFAAYLLVLFVSREVGASDLRAVKAILARRSSRS